MWTGRPATVSGSADVLPRNYALTDADETGSGNHVRVKAFYSATVYRVCDHDLDAERAALIRRFDYHTVRHRLNDGSVARVEVLPQVIGAATDGTPGARAEIATHVNSEGEWPLDGRIRIVDEGRFLIDAQLHSRRLYGGGICVVGRESAGSAGARSKGLHGK